MNERILKLAASHFPRDTEGNMYVTNEIIAEFAEAIIRECAGQCLSDDCMRILNHFGVEQ